MTSISPLTIPARLIGQANAEKVRDLSLALYRKGAELALNKGIVIADTKFEFGILEGEIVLIDEVSDTGFKPFLAQGLL